VLTLGFFHAKYIEISVQASTQGFFFLNVELSEAMARQSFIAGDAMVSFPSFSQMNIEAGSAKGCISETL
jgi:hypothetical protein